MSESGDVPAGAGGAGDPSSHLASPSLGPAATAIGGQLPTFQYDSADASQQPTSRYGDGTDRDPYAQDNTPSGPSTRPQSGAMRHSSSAAGGVVASARRAPVFEDTGPASEASRAAAAEAQAAVLKDASGGGVPAAPVGMYVGGTPQQQPQAGQTGPGAGAPTIGLGLAHMQATMFGIGGAPASESVPVARVTVPRLDDMLLKALADNYHLCPAFDWIPPEYLDNVVGLLTPGKLDFATAAALIQAEQYWARMARERWGNTAAAAAASQGGLSSPFRPKDSASSPSSLDLALHGQSWKRLYCEKHLQECLEQYHHSKQAHNYKRLLREVEACAPYVHVLRLSSLTSHVDLGDLLYDLPLLHTLSVRYGPGTRKVGMDYDRGMFGASLADAANLARLLGQGAGNITRVELRENLLGDEAIMLLMAGLHPSTGGSSAARSLTYLDLSHNKIGDIGARKLAQLLDGGLSQQQQQQQGVSGGNIGGSGDSFIGTVLTELNLSDNHVRSAGAHAFGAALANNRGLRSLDLSLNALGDAGGAALLAGCTQHTTLRVLGLNSTDLGVEAAEALLNLLNLNRSLDTIHLAANTGLFAASASSSSNGDSTVGASGFGGLRSGSSTLRDPSLSSPPPAAAADPHAGAPLLDALRQNEQVVAVDMRRTGLGAAVDEDMKALLAKRLARVKQAARKAYQKDWDAAM